jgi:hypothetical protein
VTWFANKANLTESELHVLIEVIKAVIAAVIAFFVIRHRKRQKKKEDEHRKKQVEHWEEMEKKN